MIFENNDEERTPKGPDKAPPRYGFEVVMHFPQITPTEGSLAQNPYLQGSVRLDPHVFLLPCHQQDETFYT